VKADITVILDRSGSMGVRRFDAMNGFNTLVEDQKKIPGECVFSLVQFDNEYEVNYTARQIQQVTPLTSETYAPRGSTALIDAMGRTINAIGTRLSALAPDARPEKVIVVIITDGEENASHEFTLAQVNEMIKTQRDVCKWEVTFVGTNQDAIKTAVGFGIPATHALNYADTQRGTRAAYVAMSAALGRIRRTGQTLGYTEEERSQAQDDV
jgi:uncharacterized protein YegL